MFVFRRGAVRGSKNVPRDTVCPARRERVCAEGQARGGLVLILIVFHSILPLLL